MQFKTITMLVTRRQRDHHGRTTGHPRLADDGDVVPGLEGLRVQGAGMGIRHIAESRHQRATDALGVTIDANNLLCRAIELDQTFTNLAIAHQVPDAMGRKTTVALVDESALKALLLLGVPKTVQPVLGLIGLGWKNPPATEHQR